VHEVGHDEADDRLDDDGEQARLVDRHPKGIAAEQEGKAGEPDELGHVPVKHYQLDRVAGGMDHQHNDQREQRRVHQEGESICDA
jgi:hypothetical protein